MVNVAVGELDGFTLGVVGLALGDIVGATVGTVAAVGATERKVKIQDTSLGYVPALQASVKDPDVVIPDIDAVPL